MPGLDEIIVGYTARDPMRQYADKLGGRCINCQALVYFNASAFPVLRGADHDAKIVCRVCYSTHREYIDDAM